MSALRRVSPRRLESGMAMVLALVVMMILALISAALVNLTMSEYSSAAILDSGTQALLAAEAGAEETIACLVPDNDWGTSPDCLLQIQNGGWMPFPHPDSGMPRVGDYRVALLSQSGGDIRLRVVGRVRGAARTIEYELHRLSGADFTNYSIRSVDVTQISGGGSMQWHGSAYFEGDLRLRGAAQAGFFNDRRVSSSDTGYFNHLYVRQVLEIEQGNPTIGNPYYWVHVAGGIQGSSTNFNVTRLDRVVPPPFYPDVLRTTREALTSPGNLLVAGGPGTQFVACVWSGTTWVRQNRTNLVFSGTMATSTFFLPRYDEDPATVCTDPVIYPNSIATMRSGGRYALMWDPTDSLSLGSQLSLRNDTRPVYVPGQVLVVRDFRYDGRGTLVVAAQPSAVTPGDLVAQSGCALDFNENGLCNGTPGTGHTARARISPCSGTPGTDNPSTTYPRSDVLAIFVNGSAYSNLNANSCAQEMNLVAIVGDRTSSAVFTLVRKLQWYGVLMTREMGLGQVPDFWQMPDMARYLPGFTGEQIRRPESPILTRSWREHF